MEGRSTPYCTAQEGHKPPIQRSSLSCNNRSAFSRGSFSASRRLIMGLLWQLCVVLIGCVVSVSAAETLADRATDGNWGSTFLGAFLMIICTELGDKVICKCHTR